MYEIVKAGHLLAMVIWVASMLGAGAVLAVSREEARARAALPVIRPLYLRLGGGALIAVWVLGLALVVAGGWITSAWVAGKIGLVFLLSGVHGAVSAQLRRAVEDPAHPVPAAAARLPWLVLALVTAILLLVTFALT